MTRKMIANEQKSGIERLLLQFSQQTEEERLSDDEEDNVITASPPEIKAQYHDEVSDQTIEKIEEETEQLEENRAAPQTSDKEEEEEVQSEKQLSPDEVTTKPFSTTDLHEGQEYQNEFSLQTSEGVQKEAEEEFIQSPEKVEESETEPKENVLEQISSGVKFIVTSAPSSEEEERETQEYEDELPIESSVKEDQEIEAKPETQIHAERFEQKYHEQQYQFEQHHQEQDQHRDTRESSPESLDDQHERKLNADEIITESPHESEHDEDEQYEAKQKS